MARIGITYDQVAAVADLMAGEGQKATIKCVRDRIGSGSPNTVQRHLTQWRAARPQMKVAAPELPPSLANAIASEIARASAQARAEVEDRLTQAQEEADELAVAGELLETELNELIASVATLTTERDREAGTAQERGAELLRQAQELLRERQISEQTRIEVAQNRNKLDIFAENAIMQTQKIERLRTALDTERKARIAGEQEAAVLAARLEAAQVQIAQSEIRELACQVQIKSAAGELTEVRNEIAVARTDAKQAGEKAAELRGKLAMLETRKHTAKQAVLSQT